ncbi:CPBP family intramembrane glutamic endopeptidase [Streptococcus catagoni]|uniref:CPBP family intramembrane glutamic endopeptidase n=1 Tax=Streptococcus catagoni TaxID=2654874 RepID=UPI0014092376
MCLSLITNAVIPALLEEPIFRGFLLKGVFRNHYWLGLFVTSLGFALIHSPSNIIELILYGYSGLIFGWLYLKTDRLDWSFYYILPTIAWLFYSQNDKFPSVKALMSLSKLCLKAT